MSDQQRFDSLGATGSSIARTPHIDALARNGATMMRHFTPHQICSPSRATLFTGQYSRNHGLTRNGIALDAAKDTLASDFRDAGYRTFGAGKFHFQPILAPAEHAMPDSEAFWDTQDSLNWNGPFFGFDEVQILIGESAAATRAGHYRNWLEKTAPDALGLYAREAALETPPSDFDEIWKSAIPEDLHYNRWITDRACDFIRNSDGTRPFFLFVSYPDPHHPFTPPAPWCDMFNPDDIALERAVLGKNFPSYLPRGDETDGGGGSYLENLLNPAAPFEQGMIGSTTRICDQTLQMAIAYTHAMVAMIDDCVGQIVATLKQAAVIDDTVIAYTSDHGEMLGDHGLIRKGPSPFRQLLHVPMVLSGPGIAPGYRQQMTSHLDLRATLAELFGVASGAGAGDGVSFADVVRDPATRGRDEVFAEYHPRTDKRTYNHSLITENWRLTNYPEFPEWGELFDLIADPGEMRNLYFDPAYKDIRASLTATLEARLPPAPEAGGVPLATY